MIRNQRPARITKQLCVVQTADGKISFMLSRSSRRRTLTIMVNERGEVNVASPYRMRSEAVNDFIHAKAKWINDKVKAAQEKRDLLTQKEYDAGHEFLFLGKKYKIQVIERDIKRGRIVFDETGGWVITVPLGLSDDERRTAIKFKMIQWYRQQAQEILGGRIFHFSRNMGVEPRKIAVRTQKRLWGCCDYNTQAIHLNWQIILSPMNVIDYVVVHELCHLTVPDHSKRFWHKVKTFMPDFAQYRKWLKINHYEMVLPE